MRTFMLCLLLFGLPLPALAWKGTVAYVHDGDSMGVRRAGRGAPVTIRLYGIDAPEIGQDYGEESRQALIALAPKGAEVEVVPMGTDTYGRTLGIVLRDGQVLNEVQIAAGAAWIERNHCKASVCGKWRQESNEASRNGHGLWANKPMPPWIWRKYYKPR